jgi:hypothetical protein
LFCFLGANIFVLFPFYCLSWPTNFGLRLNLKSGWIIESKFKADSQCKTFCSKNLLKQQIDFPPGNLEPKYSWSTKKFCQHASERALSDFLLMHLFICIDSRETLFGRRRYSLDDQYIYKFIWIPMIINTISQDFVNIA